LETNLLFGTRFCSHFNSTRKKLLAENLAQYVLVAFPYRFCAAVYRSLVGAATVLLSVYARAGHHALSRMPVSAFLLVLRTLVATKRFNEEDEFRIENF
jgi:hypothetical protein